jgi:hypothetical protein
MANVRPQVLRIDRRTLLASGALLAATAAAPSPPSAISLRGERAYRLRVAAAERLQQGPWPEPRSNGDETRYPDRRASFSKTLPHDELGEVDPAAFSSLVDALAQGSADNFERLPRAPSAVERLNNPQAAFAYMASGADSASILLPPPPRFDSPEMAAEMAELYWLALLADTPFRRFETDPSCEAAAHDLRAFSAAPLFGEAGSIVPQTLFRGETTGDRIGPFVSQFLLMDVPLGNKLVDQRYRFPSGGQAFLTNWDEWLACQRGAALGHVLHFDAAPRFIACGRDLAEFVHRDFSYQPYMNAALIMLALAEQSGEEVLSPTNPYRQSRTEFGDITFGMR